MNPSSSATLARRRLVLGKYAKERIDAGMSAEQMRMENALDFLYSREYSGRGVRDENADKNPKVHSAQVS